VDDFIIYTHKWLSTLRRYLLPLSSGQQKGAAGCLLTVTTYEISPFQKLQSDKLPFLWSFSNLNLPILCCAFPYSWVIFDVLCVLKVGCNTNFSRWFFIIHGNVSCFKDIADGCHRTRDIWTRTVARKSQNLSGDKQVDAVQLRVGRNNSCYETLKNFPFVGIEMHTMGLYSSFTWISTKGFVFSLITA